MISLKWLSLVVATLGISTLPLLAQKPPIPPGPPGPPASSFSEKPEIPDISAPDDYKSDQTSNPTVEATEIPGIPPSLLDDDPPEEPVGYNAPLVPAQIVTKPGRYFFNNQTSAALGANPDEKSPCCPTVSPYGSSIVEEFPPMRLVKGKPADILTDEEVLEFLQSKIKTIRQADGEVRLLRVAPGYPLSISFPEPVEQLLIGDPVLFDVSYLKKNIIALTPRARIGDASLQIFFPSGKVFVYHIFIAEDFTDGADTAIRVVPVNNAPMPGGRGANRLLSLLIIFIATVAMGLAAYLLKKKPHTPV